MAATLGRWGFRVGVHFNIGKGTNFFFSEQVGSGWGHLPSLVGIN